MFMPASKMSLVKMAKCLCFSVLLLWQFTCLSKAGEYEISAGLFFGIINYEGTGAYQLILKEAARRANIDLIESVYPLKRAVINFKEKRSLAIYGMTDAIIEEVGDENIITSYPLGIYKVYVFTRKGDKRISGFPELKGKRLGGIHGYQSYYKQLENNNIKIHYFNDEDLQMRRLQLGRIDAIIGFIPDWIPYLDTLNYDPDFPIHIGYDYMTVWKTPKGISFVEEISPALRQMKKDGSLKKILGERYMDFEYIPTKKYEWNERN